MAVQSAAGVRVLITKLVMGYGKHIQVTYMAGRKHRQLRELGKTVFFVLFCFVLFCFVLFCFCFVLFCFVLFCFVLFCFVFCFVFILFCFVFFFPFFFCFASFFGLFEQTGFYYGAFNLDNLLSL